MSPASSPHHGANSSGAVLSSDALLNPRPQGKLPWLTGAASGLFLARESSARGVPGGLARYHIAGAKRVTHDPRRRSEQGLTPRCV